MEYQSGWLSYWSVLPHSGCTVRRLLWGWIILSVLLQMPLSCERSGTWTTNWNLKKESAFYKNIKYDSNTTVMYERFLHLRAAYTAVQPRHLRTVLERGCSGSLWGYQQKSSLAKQHIVNFTTFLVVTKTSLKECETVNAVLRLELSISYSTGYIV